MKKFLNCKISFPKANFEEHDQMDEDNMLDVGKTIEVFDLRVDDAMLPGGSNPFGRGAMIKYSKNKLELDDIPRLILGPEEVKAWI